MKPFIILLTLSTLVIGTLCLSASSVWVAEKDGSKVFIGGTVHMLSEQDYPLPDAYMTAYKQADELLFETDIESLSSMSTQMKIVQQLSYQDGRTIDDDLTPETMAKLEQHFASRGVPLSMFKSYKPGFIGMTITAIEMQILGVTAKGVDEYFKTMAKKDNKPVSWFESVEDQVGFVIGMADGNENELINYFIDSVSDTKTTWDAMLVQWRAGDMEGLNEDFLLPLEKEHSQMNEVLITSRNEKWIPQIESLFADNDTEFVLVGTLHLAGDNGVLNLLEKSGYAVSKVE